MNMIEKVARAMCRRQINKNESLWKQNRTEEFKQSAEDYAWKNYIDEACAAIEAMREPTEEMINILDGSIGSSGEAKLAYHAMIDAALKE